MQLTITFAKLSELSSIRAYSSYVAHSGRLARVFVMKDRFTHKSTTIRRRIPGKVRSRVFSRDNYTCQFCGKTLSSNMLTVDHMIPLDRSGTNDETNLVTCCRECNHRKANLPLQVFARSINIKVEDLPVHGDPLIDDHNLPIEIRLLRKKIYDRVRSGELRIRGTAFQRKLERTYRYELAKTSAGRKLAMEFPRLPGNVRHMVPQIRAIARNQREFILLAELAKSAHTRNLIGSVLKPGVDVESVVNDVHNKTRDESLKKRIGYALNRFKQEIKSRLESTP